MPGVSVAQVARRYDVNANQIFECAGRGEGGRRCASVRPAEGRACDECERRFDYVRLSRTGTKEIGSCDRVHSL